MDTLEARLTAAEAAAEIGCHVSTISRWVKNNYLKPIYCDESGNRIYKRGDVLVAERAARRKALGGRA